MPGDDEALRQELLLARSVSHPNVCRVHDLAPSPYGPILVMEYITGQTLHTHIRRKKAQGGYTADEFRRIAHDVASGVAAIHAQGLVHGDLKPGNVMVTTNTDGSFGKAIVLDFGFAKERARASARRPGAPPDGGTPNYMSPERIRSGGASPEDDVYALGLTLLEMWTCRVPEPATSRARRRCASRSCSTSRGAEHRRDQAGLPLLLGRPAAAPARAAPALLQPRHADDQPHPGAARAPRSGAAAGAQRVAVVRARHAGAPGHVRDQRPEFVGELMSLDKPVVTIGRRADNDMCVPEATVSGQHAQLKWQNATWIVEDSARPTARTSTTPTSAARAVNLMHGGEVQLGELRFKLVSFGKDSANHKRARAYLAKRDGLTGMLTRDQLLRALDEEAAFADWVEAPLTIARYELRGPNRLVSDRPTDPRDARPASRGDARRRADRHAAALAHRRDGGPHRAAALLRGHGRPRPARGAQPRRAGGRPGAGHAAGGARARRPTIARYEPGIACARSSTPEERPDAARRARPRVGCRRHAGATRAFAPAVRSRTPRMASRSSGLASWASDDGRTRAAAGRGAAAGARAGRRAASTSGAARMRRETADRARPLAATPPSSRGGARRRRGHRLGDVPGRGGSRVPVPSSSRTRACSLARTGARKTRPTSAIASPVEQASPRHQAGGHVRVRPGGGGDAAAVMAAPSSTWPT
jgi:hypothetical protein